MTESLAPPTFASHADHVAHIGDVGFWRPYVADILRRHGLADGAREPVAGHNATHPTFVCGDVVVKLFGRSRAWRASHAAERAAQACAAADPAIAAPRVLGEGTTSGAIAFAAGLVWAVGGRPRVIFPFTTAGEKIVAIELAADPERIGRLALVAED